MEGDSEVTVSAAPASAGSDLWDHYVQCPRPIQNLCIGSSAYCSTCKQCFPHKATLSVSRVLELTLLPSSEKESIKLTINEIFQSVQRKNPNERSVIKVRKDRVVDALNKALHAAANWDGSDLDQVIAAYAKYAREPKASVAVSKKRARPTTLTFAGDMEKTLERQMAQANQTRVIADLWTAISECEKNVADETAELYRLAESVQKQEDELADLQARVAEETAKLGSMHVGRRHLPLVRRAQKQKLAHAGPDLHQC